MKLSIVTAVFLVTLRLVIGWHFLFEGVHKLHTTWIGPTETNRPFSSAGYFREAPGPLAKFFRQQIGDPDDLALARLTVEPIPEGQDPATYPPHKRMPPALKQDWEEAVRRFSEHYQLSEEQKKYLQGKLEQAADNIVLWMTRTTIDNNTREVEKTYPSGKVNVKVPVAQRIAEYRAAVQELRTTLDKKLFAFGHDVEGKRLPAAKADIARLRAGLISELDETADLTRALNDVFFEEGRSAAGATVGPAGAVLAYNKVPLKEVPPAPDKGWLGWIDWLTEWGLTVMGACLIVGLFTRLNCVLAAGFLLMTYFCAPPFPWLPVPPNSEGFYAYINKNVVEMVALVVLATTHSGRWLGVDALIHQVIVSLRGKPAQPGWRRGPLAA
jgi:uncharacterized membrane protein YphA (DoxX/SURF4 family)